MKIFFTFTPKQGHNWNDRLYELFQNNDFYKYITSSVGKELRLELRPAVKKDSKQALYDYYHGPLMSVAIGAYTHAGYEMMDEVKCDYLLKLECAQGTMTTPEGEKIYILDKSKMTKDRLIKFVNDVIDHLVYNLGVPIENIPDAQAYKSMKQHGAEFQSVKFQKDE